MKLDNILNTDNLTTLLDEETLDKILSQVTTQFTTDKESRASKQELLSEIVQLALSVSQDKSFPWAGSSNTMFPLISTAIIDFGAKCSPEILRDDAIVKSKIIGKDEGSKMYSVAGDVILDEETGLPQLMNIAAKQKRGDRVATYMNYQLNEEIEGWVEDTDKLLVSLAAVGMMFRKVYINNDKIMSELVYPDKLIMHDKINSFDNAPITHVIELYNNQIQDKVRQKHFIDFDYNESSSDSTSSVLNNDLSDSQDTDGSNEDSGLHIFLEQCCWLDLDDDGYLEPYVVTVHQTSNTIVRVAKRYTKDDIVKEGDKIMSIKAHNPYIAYPFIPSPDGSFYAIGLGHLLFNINKSVNTSINQLTDAGTLQTTGGGFIAKSLKIRGGSFKMKPNEYKMVDSYGSSIRDSIVPLPTPEPSQTLFALLGFLVQSGKELGSLRDVLTGENAANVQATTMMAMVEQGITQFRSIYKRVYRSLKSELRKIYHLNSLNIDNKKYSEVLDEPIGDVDYKSDFSKKGFDIVPVADVASVTNTQRMAKAAYLMQFMNDPYIDQMLLRKEILASANITNYKDLITAPPAQQPDVNTILAQAEVSKAENRLKEIQIKAIETSASIEKGSFDIQKIIAEIEKMKTEAIKNISEAVSKENKMQLDNIMMTTDAIRKDIELEAKNQTITQPNLRNEKINEPLQENTQESI